MWGSFLGVDFGGVGGPILGLLWGFFLGCFRHFVGAVLGVFGC